MLYIYDLLAIALPFVTIAFGVLVAAFVLSSLLSE